MKVLKYLFIESYYTEYYEQIPNYLKTFLNLQLYNFITTVNG